MIHRNPQPITAVWTIFYPFYTPLWIAIILSTLVVTLIMIFINMLKFGKDSPTFHIIAISLLSILSESFPTKYFQDKIRSQVVMILYVWLPMSFLLGSVYKSSLLQFLVAGEFEDPPDTFEKVMERDLLIAMPTGTVIDQLFKTAPYKSMRLAYKHGEERGGFFPWSSSAPTWIEQTLSEGKGVGFSTADQNVGSRHKTVRSKREYPIGYLLNGFLFKRNSHLRSKMQPIIMTLIDTGIFEYLKDKFLWHRARPEREHYRLNQHEHLIVLTWNHVGWTFLLVASSGLAVASVAFVLEAFTYKRNTQYYDLFEL